MNTEWTIFLLWVVGSLPGIDFKMKNIQAGNARLKLQMWDTAGQDRFQTLTNTFFKGRHI